MKELNSLEKFYKKADEFMRLESLQAPAKVVSTEVGNNNAAPNKKESGTQKREKDGGRSREMRRKIILFTSLP